MGKASAHAPLPLLSHRFPTGRSCDINPGLGGLAMSVCRCTVKALAVPTRGSSSGRALLVPTICNPKLPSFFGGGPLGPERTGGSGALPGRQAGAVGLDLGGGAVAGLTTCTGTASAHGPCGFTERTPSRPMEPTVITPWDSPEFPKTLGLAGGRWA